VLQFIYSYAECHIAEWRYAECRSAVCRGAFLQTFVNFLQAFLYTFYKHPLNIFLTSYDLFSILLLYSYNNYLGILLKYSKHLLFEI